MSETTDEVLALTVKVLSDFEDVPLAATVRRMIRIANLLGESETAIRYLLELQPVGGHPLSNRGDIERFMRNAAEFENDGSEIDVVHRAYMADRLIGNDQIWSSSLAEMDMQISDLESYLTHPPSKTQAKGAERYWQIVAIRQRVTTRAFAKLCHWERQLRFTQINYDVLDNRRTLVERLLATEAPDVLDRFNSAYRRLRDASAGTIAINVNEDMSQAATSCRRILKAIVDHVQPVDPNRPKAETGHALNDSTYKNRLYESFKRIESDSFREALVKTTDALSARFAAIDALASKGVHGDLAFREVEFCVANTFLLAGEILHLHHLND